jgi:multiple sugar transport system permease protein
MFLVEEPPPAPPPPTATAAPRSARFHHVAAASVPYLYLLPALASFAVWVYLPLADTIRYSTVSWNLLPTSPETGVGLANYRNVLALPEIRQALCTTGLYLAGLVVLGVIVPVLLGAVTRPLGSRTRAVYHGVLFVPVLVSPIVAGIMWSFLLAPNGGVVNDLLARLGIAAHNWLLEPGTARGAVVLITGWKVLGASVLIVTAGLAAISPEYHEAAAIDGAGRLRTFREVTLPLLSPTLVFLFTTAVLLSESQIIFPLVNSLTSGGPGNATSDLYYLLYSFGFTSFDVGLASAAGVLFFAAFAVIAVACVALLDRFSFYQD